MLKNTAETIVIITNSVRSTYMHLSLFRKSMVPHAYYCTIVVNLVFGAALCMRTLVLVEVFLAVTLYNYCRSLFYQLSRPLNVQHLVTVVVPEIYPMRL